MQSLLGPFAEVQDPQLQDTVDAGADVDLEDEDSVHGTTMHGAALRGLANNIEALAAAGVDTQETAPDSEETPLHAAAALSWEAAVKTLVRLGADVNAVDANGSTPLHHAASHIFENTSGVVQFLLEAGADETIADVDGKKAMELIFQPFKEEAYDMNDNQEGAVRALLEDSGRWTAHRAWRRRRLVVMGRNRADLALLAELSKRAKLAKTEHSFDGKGDDGDISGNAVGPGGETHKFKAAMVWLLGVDVGVFRNIVTCL